MRALLDTNVFVSYLLTPQETGSIRLIFRAFEIGQFTLLLPQQLFIEINEVVNNRPQLAHRIVPERFNRFREKLRSLAEVIPIIDETIPRLTRDHKDDYLIAYAVVGEADYLVTGDKDLLVLGSVGGVTIVTPVYFANLLTQTA
jgi:putative PIN family toxin of toxin-antitoxin system